MTLAHKLLDRTALLLGQWFGTGLAPLAPGTAGSLGALPLVLFIRHEPWIYWITTLSICLLGIPIAQRCSELLDQEDPSSVVIDEVAGVLLALGPLLYEPWYTWVAAWLLFRVLDITKPGWIDKAQHLKPSGLGIMADDLLAGILVGLLGGWLSHVVLH